MLSRTKLVNLVKTVVPKQSYSVANAKDNRKWDLLSAVSLERKPIITRDLNDLETKFSALLSRIEDENSHKSDFEIKLESDKMRAKAIKEGKVTSTDLDGAPQQTAQDFLDACQEELKAFKFSNRKAPEETENDKKSLNRALDRNLLLLVKEKIGEKPTWILPQGLRLEGETLRQTAERVLREKCGQQLKVRFYGNAPCGFYKYKYPAVINSSSHGAKVFFFKAQLLGGNVNLSEGACEDFHWATRSEMDKLYAKYLNSIKMFLIDEEH